MSTTTDPVSLPTPGDVVAMAQPPSDTGDPVPDILVRVLDEGVDHLVVQDVDPSDWSPVAHPWHLPLGHFMDVYAWEVVG